MPQEKTMKNVKVTLRVVHSIPGRARVKITSGLDPKIFFLVLEAGLREMPTVKKAELNPYSQSATLFFKKDLDVAEVLEEMEQFLTDITDDPAFPRRLEDIKEILEFGDKETMHVSVRNHILTVSHSLDRTVKRMTGNTMDMRTAVPITSFASGVGFLLLAPGLPTPTWLVLVTFGITSFHLLKHAHVDGQETETRSRTLTKDDREQGLLEAVEPA